MSAPHLLFVVSFVICCKVQPGESALESLDDVENYYSGFPASESVCPKTTSKFLKPQLVGENNFVSYAVINKIIYFNVMLWI